MTRKSTTVYLDDEQLGELQRIKEATGIPVAVMIRRGVDLAINWYDGWLEERDSTEGGKDEGLAP